MSLNAATRYAKALYQEASKGDKVDEVLAALRKVRGSADQLPQLKGFLKNPLLTYEEQIAVIHALFKGKLPDLVVTFLDFISSKRRLDHCVAIIDAFESIYHDEHNAIIMKAVSAHTLDEALKKDLTDRIAQLTGKKVIGEYIIDPSIIGGIRVWAAGKLYEYSFSNELHDYKRGALQNV